MSRPPANEIRNRNTVNNGLIDFQDNMSTMMQGAYAASGAGTPLMFYATDPSAGTAVNVYSSTAASAAAPTTVSPYTLQSGYAIATPAQPQQTATYFVAPNGAIATPAATLPAAPQAVGAAAVGPAGHILASGMVSSAAMTQASLNGAVVMGPPSEVHVNGKVYRMVPEKLAAPVAATATAKKPVVAAVAGASAVRPVGTSRKTLDETIQDRVDKRVQEFMAKTQRSSLGGAMRLASSSASAARRPASASLSVSETAKKARDIEQAFQRHLKALEEASNAKRGVAAAAPRRNRK